VTERKTGNMQLLEACKAICKGGTGRKSLSYVGNMRLLEGKRRACRKEKAEEKKGVGVEEMGIICIY
jgi:hypothetical protein